MSSDALPEADGLLSRITKKRYMGDNFKKNQHEATVEDVLALGLQASDVSKIVVCDRLGDLTMFHFKENYDQEDASEEGGEKVAGNSDVEEVDLKASKNWGDLIENVSEKKKKIFESMKERVSAVRGWILSNKIQDNKTEGGNKTEGNKVTRKLICKSFGSTSIVHLNPSQLSNYKDMGYVFHLFIEGSTLRFFWLSEPTAEDASAGRWVRSSYRKIDSVNSRIPGIELGFQQMFDEASPNFDLSQLNKDYIYVFQVMHRDNQIMNQDIIDRPVVYHIATITGHNCLEPMKLLPLVPNQIKGVYTIDEIPFDAAVEFLQVRKSIMACRGYEIVQLAPKSIENLMRIRGYQATDSVPYIPIELMYLRLPVNDRSYLVEAVPPHQKLLASDERMKEYIDFNTDKLADFCTQILMAKISGNRVSFSKTLKWLVGKVRLENRNSTHMSIKHEYLGVIHQMVYFNGESAYRCFRDMESALKHIEKKSTAAGLNAGLTGSGIFVTSQMHTSHPEEFFPDRPFVAPQLPTAQNTRSLNGKIQKNGKNQVQSSQNGKSRAKSQRSPNTKNTNPNTNNTKNGKRANPVSNAKRANPVPKPVESTASTVDDFFDMMRRKK